MGTTKKDLELLSDLEEKLASHFAFICENTINLFNSEYKPNEYMIIVGGRLLKYMTPPDKIFDPNYLQQVDSVSRKKLLNSYDTDIKLFVYHDILKGKPYNTDNIIDLYEDIIINKFVDSLIIDNKYLDLKLYYIESVLNNFGLQLDLKQSSLKEISTLNATNCKKK